MERQARYSMGDRIEWNPDDGKWLPGTVTNIRDDGAAVGITLDENGQSMWVDSRNVRPMVKSKLIVVCGSVSDEPRLLAAALPERAGHCVVIPHRDSTLTPAEHAAEWRRWIDRADEVLVVRKPDGSIGDAVTAEMAYARDVGCPVRWWPENQAVMERAL